MTVPAILAARKPAAPHAGAPLVVERDGGVVVATLARPPVNALDADLVARLAELVDAASATAGPPCCTSGATSARSAPAPTSR